MVSNKLQGRDSDHASYLDSRKRTSSGIQFLGGDKLVSWPSKKQDCTSMSSAEAEYHFIKEKVEKSIIELFFIGTEYQLADLFTKVLSEERFKYLVRRLAIAISCNPVQHSRTKHIDVRYHFIKDKVKKYLVRRLGMRCLTPAELEALANESA
nr:hypothetical protein [Tanacetum cinerariifolium]